MTKERYVLLVTLGTLFVFMQANSIPALGEPIWEPSIPLLEARTGPGVTIGPDGAIYAIGGEGKNPKAPLKTAEKWYEGQSAWQSISPMSVERSIAGVITDSFGYIWATGGVTFDQSILDTVEIYDTTSNTWQSGKPMNEKRTGHGVAIDSSGCIYVFGGRDALEATSSVEKYDLLTGQWTYISPMNEARICMGVAVDQQGRIYAIGGTTYSNGLGQLLKTVEVYNPANPILGWQYVADIPAVVGYGAAFLYDGEIWLVGGNSTYSYWTNDCYIYSPNTNSWRSGPKMYEILCLAGVTVGPSGTTYLIGGERGGGSVASNHVTMLAQEILIVNIDIKPGSYPNAINLGSHGLVPVAILSDEEFDATTVDPDTVELAGADVAVRGKSNKFMAHEEDVNGDELLDLVVQVATANLNPDSFQDGYAVLTGKTYDGQNIEGSDEITIVPTE